MDKKMESTIIRTNKRENPYVMIDKCGLNDERLSWKAKGLLAYLLSKPDDWKIYEVDLIKHATDGRDSVRTCLRELEKFGYLSRRQIRGSNGFFGHMEYIIYERPLFLDTVEKKSADSTNPWTGNPLTENPSTGNPLTENPLLLSNDLTNNDLTKDDDDNKHTSFFKIFKKLKNDFVTPCLLEMDEFNCVIKRIEGKKITHLFEYARKALLIAVEQKRMQEEKYQKKHAETVSKMTVKRVQVRRNQNGKPVIPIVQPGVEKITLSPEELERARELARQLDEEREQPILYGY